MLHTEYSHSRNTKFTSAGHGTFKLWICNVPRDMVVLCDWWLLSAYLPSVSVILRPKYQTDVVWRTIRARLDFCVLYARRRTSTRVNERSVSVGVADANNIMHSCITDAICPTGSRSGRLGLRNFAGSGGMFTLAAPSDLAAVSVAFDAAVGLLGLITDVRCSVSVM